MAVRVKGLDLRTVEGLWAIDPQQITELFDQPMCESRSPAGKRCMMPAGHMGRHGPLFLALAVIESWERADDEDEDSGPDRGR